MHAVLFSLMICVILGTDAVTFTPPLAGSSTQFGCHLLCIGLYSWENRNLRMCVVRDSCVILVCSCGKAGYDLALTLAISGSCALLPTHQACRTVSTAA